ncbi:MAG: glutamate--tRNA ligase [Candidatus Altarchaeaceae archaeon]
MEKIIDLGNFEGKVVVRFAPNPSGYLHIGHARAAILNDEIAKEYNGKLILRIEDTDPSRVDIESYEAIEEDLKWLNIKWHEKIIQSSRLEIYEKFAKQLIEEGNAYLCNCDTEKFKNLKLKHQICVHRNLSIKENLENFEKMKYEDGWVVRVKTSPGLQNTSLIDFPILRTSRIQHPLLKNKDQRIYPLMNFSVTIDDHLLGITHVLRGKDHLINTEKQKFLYKFFNWEPPKFIHYGMMNIQNEGKISKSEIKKGIEEKIYTGWDDVRLLTLRALKRRGINPAAIREYIISIGIKDADISFSEEILYSMNKKYVEKSKRYFFVDNPVKLIVENFPNLILDMPLHKDYDYGYRHYEINPKNGRVTFFIRKEDSENIKVGEEIRLMNLCNVKILKIDNEIYGNYVNDSHSPMAKVNGKIGEHKKYYKCKKILWILDEHFLKAKVFSPERNYEGYCEIHCKNLKEDDIIQFEGFGFCRVDKINDEIEFCFGHR